MKKSIFVLVFISTIVLYGFCNSNSLIHFGDWHTTSCDSIAHNVGSYPFGENLDKCQVRLSDYNDYYDGGYGDIRKYKKFRNAAIAMTAIGGGLTVIGSIVLGAGCGYTYLIYGFLESYLFTAFLATAIVFYAFALPAWIVMIPMWAMTAHYHERISVLSDSDGSRMSCGIRISL